MKYFYINKKKYKLPNKNNNSIIDYCNNLGIIIPHFCYHQKLSVAGNCRMCLVELKNSPKPLLACAMTLTNKMEIFTESHLVKKARENILEFLLLNHPLDCPVCDQGGECDLQDQALFYGTSKKRFYNYKRVVTNKNLGILIKTVMTRCIHCTRCVRFSNEIAGKSELGIFGRGLHSEIGTYLPKSFSSELSGNVIDICPVGALTSKPYSFVSRPWELKIVRSIDFTDSFSLNILVYIKDNSVFKILSNHNQDNNVLNNIWVTDKIRFSFNGMFSPERISETFILIEKSLKKHTWKSLIKELVLNIYFKDHLTKHLIKKFYITFIIYFEVCFEVLLILILLNKRYSFIDFKKLETYRVKNDLEYDFLSQFTKKKINKTNLCCMFNINLRYESPYLNILLRKHFLKGNFKILCFGSFVNLNYPVNNIGFNYNNIMKFIEGNHPNCQYIANSVNPLFLLGSNLCKRNDSYFLMNAISFFKKINPLSSINYLHFSFYDSTINYIKKLKTYSILDYNRSNVLYLLNPDFKVFNWEKFIMLKLLKICKEKTLFSKILIQQNNHTPFFFFEKINNSFMSYIYFNLPNKVFFEESGIYVSNGGILKKKIEVIKNYNNNIKSNWGLLRNFLLLTSNLFFLNNSNCYKFVSLKIKKFSLILNYISLIFLPKKVNSIYKNNFNNLNYVNFFNKKLKKKYYVKKIKILNTKGSFWLEDFFIGDKITYNNLSTIMIKCSKNKRFISTNFLL